MDLLQLMRVTRRRWYIAGPVFFLAALLSLFMSGEIQPEYQATGSVLLVGPGTPPTAVTGLETEDVLNPYLSFSGSLNTTADALVLAMSTDDVADHLTENQLSPDFLVSVDRRSPVLTLTATSEKSETATNTVARLTELLIDELKRRQDVAGAPEGQRISVTPLSTNLSGPDGTERTRVRLLVGGLGMALSVALASLYDSAATARPGTGGGLPVIGRHPPETVTVKTPSASITGEENDTPPPPLKRDAVFPVPGPPRVPRVHPGVPKAHPGVHNTPAGPEGEDDETPLSSASDRPLSQGAGADSG